MPLFTKSYSVSILIINLKSGKNIKRFLFSIPSKRKNLSAEANIALQMGALASKQIDINRTRCIHTGGRPENIAEHSLMLAKVAPELAVLLYPELDENLVARYSTLHDDIEIYVGDTPTDTLANLDLSKKEDREKAGIIKLLEEYSHIPSYTKLITSYESQTVPEAIFVRAVDKLMVLLIHIPNNGSTLQENYTYESFLESEKTLLQRDRYKYGQFEKIVQLRKELAQELADRYLKK